MKEKIGNLKESSKLNLITKKNVKNSKGITLIALILTIIILMILAGITFEAIAGENGIISNAMKSKKLTEEASAREMLEMVWSARMAKFIEDISNGRATEKDIENYFAIDDLNAMLGNNGRITGIKYIKGQETFKINYETESHIWYTGRIKKSGKIMQFEIGTTENINQTEIISETIGYTMYYADIDDDGNVDGIIYADLAIGNTGDGQWTDDYGNYTIPTKNNFKKYYINRRYYKDDFGTKDVISPVDRYNRKR